MTPSQLELITAAVDGELSATEARALRVLLAGSADARGLFAQLKTHRERVRALPRVAPPADLQAKIMARIAGATPAPRLQSLVLAARASAPVPRHRLWVQVAVAASVLFCVTAGSFVYFNSTAPKNQIAKNAWAHALPSQRDTPTTVPSPTAPLHERPDPAAVARVDVFPAPPVPTPRAVPPAAAVGTAPAPRTVTPDLIGFPLLPKLAPFERVEVRLPFLRPVADLGREDIAQELLDELRYDPPFRFDIFARDAARGVEVFQSAARASGMAVHADAATLDKLKKKQLHSVVIYTESLSALELTALFAALAIEDAKFSPKVCDSLHATAVVRADELDLRAVLGFDVGLYKRPTNAPAGGTGQGGDRHSPAKSVTSGTIDSVVKSVTSPSAKAAEKPAVLMTWQTTHPSIPRTTPTTSAELKQYLAKRGDRKPNAVPAIIVIRGS